MLSLDEYDYVLPPGLIANSPVSPRDSARLFIYDTATNEVTFDTFRNIGKHLPHPSLLVFNDTKVIPARLWLKKETLPAPPGSSRRAGGGKIEVLLMLNEYQPGDALVKGVVDRKLLPGAKLFFQSGDHLFVERQEEQFFFFKPNVSIAKLRALIEREGTTPIPPYIKESELSEKALREKYQSVLAKHPSSIAAPTASLHFTKSLVEKLVKGGVKHTEVTLHVGAGTFAPINEQNLAKKKLFTEYYEIGKNAAKHISSAKENGVPVIPVGTTAMRTLESVAVQGETLNSYEVRPCSGKTDIFIFPPYKFKIADALITNFHVPRSSLMLLVDAFLESKMARRRILDLYDIAIKEKFRFYSFGDGMLIK